MTQSLSKTKTSGAVAKACFFTAVLNSLFAPGYAQQVLPENLPEAQSDDLGLAERALQWGPFDIRPTLRGSMVYDDNIFIQDTDKEGDLIWTIAPGVLLGAGDYIGREANLFTLSYTPSIILFTDNTDQNSVDHDARLRAELHENRWSFSLEQDFQVLSGAVIDVGDRIDRRLYTTSAAFEYEISPKTSFDITGRQMINDYDDVNDFSEWAFGAGADYALTPKVKVGLGTVFGFVDVQGSGNQTYQQGLVRGSYLVSEKIEARGSIGGEIRQFEGDQSNRGDLVFSAGGVYKPFLNTRISFDTYRKTQTSVIQADANYTSTGINAGIRQLFRDKYTAHLSAGYEHNDYKDTDSGANVDRTDDYFVVRTGAEWNVIERMTLGIFYQYRYNDSSSNFDFANHQVGLTAGYQF